MEGPRETLPPTRTSPQDSALSPILGSWLEKMPQNVVYFAGYRMEWTFGRDSLLLQLHHWTDVIACIEENDVLRCEDNAWTHDYKGTWTLQDSLLRIECRRAPAGDSAGMDTTLHRVAYRVTSGPGDSLSLQHQGLPGDFLAVRKNVLLQRVPKLSE